MAKPLVPGHELPRLNQDGSVSLGGTLKDVQGIVVNVVSKTAAYTANARDRTILCDASGGAFTVTLPAVSGLSGTMYDIKKIDSSVNAVTIDGNGSETIDGDTTRALSSQYDSLTIIVGPSEWSII